ncbi:hypothetical protein FIBSPDRAFT_923865 [Athelia psychrophila]|uniref:Uncharacterized protein n=1 Tax=Athelia psychrophila TaxID=1759441 RepID=A0A166X1I8_9AGAM|nr:hypothetical protein FIBSPDRAFT_923865 [Fibularhizoctonia sp. CBS 109695]
MAAILFSGFRTGVIQLIYHISSIHSQKSTEIINILSPGGASGPDHLAVWVDHVTSPDVLSVARTHRVVSATWLKKKGGAPHEALELKVTDGSLSLWIFVERGVSESVQRTPSPSSTPSSSTASLNTSAGNSGQLSSPHAAEDNVTVRATSLVGGLRSKYQVVATLDIPADSANPLTVSDMAALLSIVSLSQPEYNPVYDNCNWFVATIIYVIEAQHGGRVCLTNIGTSPGHLGIVPVMSADDTQKAVLKVMPAWAAQKAIYRTKKTTEENKREADERVAREVEARRKAEEREAEARVKQAEERVERDANARQGPEARIQNLEVQLA